VLAWAELHKSELLDDWLLALQGQPLKRIAPLRTAHPIAAMVSG
jgi:hypothetical protein